MADFKKAYELTALIEGGYSNDPVDTGGESFAGISRKNFPAWYGWTLIDTAKGKPDFPDALNNMPGMISQAYAFYKIEFWDKLRLDEINSQALAEELYDTAVNMGTYIAGIFLQKALNALNSGANIPPTGTIGPLTLAAVNKIQDPIDVLKVLNCLQGARYVEICLANPKQEKFLHGWLKRVTL